MANCITCKANCISAGQHRVNTRCISYVPKDYPKPKTNEERFNAMTTEEKADYIRVFFPELCPPRKCPEEDDCRNCWLNWLKQEVNND